MERKEYNGWTNYETWLVKLWMDNSEGACEYWQEQAQDAYKFAQPSYASQTPKEKAQCDLAEWLKDYHEENSPAGATGVYADLINAALAEVNWYEIAGALLEGITEDDEEASEDEEEG